tara:strand:+ start:91023 stop:91715 length:693 start_codon:yes stop_codon:yes gene_type:complete
MSGMYRNKRAIFVFITIIYTSLSFSVFSQNNIKSKSPKISVINEDSQLPTSIIKGFENIIATVYPELIRDFNKKARMDVTVKIDTTYDGVAYAHDGRVTVSSKWLYKKPEDLDLMTHEIMHIIQSYPNDAGPGWLTEGIADFVRYKYGVDNQAAGWYLPEFSQTQSYTNSYRITARFLVWISQNYNKKIVYKMDAKLRSKTYAPELWQKYTGLTIDELWTKYSKNPTLKI